MAHMYPSTPRECTEASKERLMFEALESLPDDYHVFHSFKIITMRDNLLSESETDFVIFNPQKGIICLEAKAGHVRCIDEEWYYGSGKKMDGSGPYRQASDNVWKLVKYLKDKGMTDITRNCKILHAVWFPSISETELLTVTLPSDAEATVTLTAEALDDPTYYIDRLFDVPIRGRITTDLEDYQVEKLLRNVLCPRFGLVPSVKTDMENTKRIFNRLLNEQKNILNYLEEQPNAVINGVAGSGKTMIAVEKARRCGENGDQVLFLTYNKFLREYLNKNSKNPNVSYYTIDGLACKLCNTEKSDIDLLSKKLIEMFKEGTFPYKHVIIDEAQDFGKEKIEEADIIKILEKGILDEMVQGCFYLFYDKLQLIQAEEIPSYIQDADCRLTLYKNCRNTKNIAVTSLRPFPDIKKPTLMPDVVDGVSPRLFMVPSAIGAINQILKEHQKSGISNVVILTCKTEKSSVLTSKVQNGKYTYANKSYTFTTCRKFKGLEADAVILIDVDKEALKRDGANLFYVGSSRARVFLDMVSTLEEEECAEVLLTFGKKARRSAKKGLATLLNARLFELKQ